MKRLEKQKRKILWAVIFLMATLLGGEEVWAKIYSIQLGVFQNYQNAQRQFKQFKKLLPPHLSNHLRIEKSGDDYTIKVGKLDDREQALNLLAALKDHAPGAFIRQGEWIPQDILEIQKNPNDPGEDRSRERKVLRGDGKKIEPPRKDDQPPQTNQAMLSGTIREVRSLAPEQLGLPSGKNIYRLIVQVESTKSLKGGPDFIKEKEGELLTVFSETNPPIFRPGNKISAVVEYRGNRLSRFYWINKPQTVNP